MRQLSDFEKDALKEVINIGAGKAASVLNTMLQAPITLKVPVVDVINKNDAREQVESSGENSVSSVSLPFEGEISGSAALLFPSESAYKLVSVLIGDMMANADLDAMRSGTLNELGNIVINGVMGVISNMMSQDFNYSVPIYAEGDSEDLIFLSQSNGDAILMLAQTEFNVESLKVKGHILLVFDVDSFDVFIDKLMKYGTRSL